MEVNGVLLLFWGCHGCRNSVISASQNFVSEF